MVGAAANSSVLSECICNNCRKGLVRVCNERGATYAHGNEILIYLADNKGIERASPGAQRAKLKISSFWL